MGPRAFEELRGWKPVLVERLVVPVGEVGSNNETGDD